MSATAVVYHPWNLQQINANGGLTKGPAAASDPFGSVFGNQQHVVYRDSAGWIWDSWFDGQWNLQQINANGGLTKGPPAVGGPFVWTVAGSTRQQHFTYRDQEGSIWDPWYDGHWNLQKINGAGGLTQAPAAVGNPSASVFGSQQHIGYRDQKGTIWDSWYDGRWNLQHINAGGVTDGPAAAGGPFIWTAGSQQHFTYGDQKGWIWDCWYDGRWHLQQLNATGGLTSGPPMVGEPCAASFGSQQHVFYRDNQGTIWDSWYSGHGWSLQPLNNPSGVTKAPPAVGDPFVSLFGKEQMHVGYRSGVGAIWDSWYDQTTSRWNLQLINAGGLTKGPAAVGGPSIWTVAGGTAQQHFAYRDQKGTIWDSWFDSPPATYGAAPSVGLYINSVTILNSSGSQIPAPIAGQAFKMSVNIVNGAGANVPGSTLTVEMTASDNSSSQSFTANVPPLASGGGATVSVSIPALTAGLTYDFNFYDPTTVQIGYESFSL
jgi:hypothetical protein